MDKIDPVSREKIEKMSLHNQIIHNCLSYYKRGDVTWEQAMMCAVATLAEQNEALTKVAENRMQQRKNMFDTILY